MIALTRRLRMPYLRKAAVDVVPTARAQRWDPAELLRVLLAEEITGRDEATLRMRAPAGELPGRQDLRRLGRDALLHPRTHPAGAAHPGVGRPAREPVRLRAQSGTGKSHFCEALGQLAIDTGRTVAWFTIEDLGALVRRHRADDSITKAVRRITRVDLIIVDDIGMLPVGEDAAEGFYRLVDACYEKRSLAVSSNLHPSGFDEIMPKTLATATVDRLLHHAHICVTDGQSYRLAQATAGKGVRPLPN